MKTLLIFSLLVFSIIGTNASVDCDSNFPFRLDVGFFWAGINASTGGIYWEKSCQKHISTLFDPQRETLIFFHGLQPGSVAMKHRFFFDDVELHPAVQAHVSLGKNVGVFQWTQFADEPITNFIRAEAKLVTSDFVSHMEYLYEDSDGSIKVADSAYNSVVDVAFEQYLLHAPFESRVHFIGHSLGTQLVVYLAHKIVQHNEEKSEVPGFVPVRLDRVTMLDPVYSDADKPYNRRNTCGNDNSSVLGCYMHLILKSGIAIDMYRATFINRCIFSSEDDALMAYNSAAVGLKLTAYGSIKSGDCRNIDLFSHLSPKELSALGSQLKNQHRDVIAWFVSSFFTDSPPKICVKNKKGICKPTEAPSVHALMSDADVLEWARSNKCLIQLDNAGTKNYDPSDDLFFVSDCQNFNT